MHGMKNNAKHWLKNWAQEKKKALAFNNSTGLGEMNAEQLWEATMNPITRALQRSNY